MINKFHYRHLGLQKCRSLERESIFRPSIDNQIEKVIPDGHLYSKYARSQNKEHPLSHEIPGQPKDCFFFKYVEFDELSNTTSDTVIRIKKHNFAPHGDPVTVILDGGPQFTSKEFLNFYKAFKFNHIETSSTYA